MMVFFGTKLGEILIWQKISSTWEFDFNFDCITDFAVISIFHFDYVIEWLDWATEAAA